MGSATARSKATRPAQHPRTAAATTAADPHAYAGWTSDTGSSTTDPNSASSWKIENA
jgi:hypothetical protein